MKNAYLLMRTLIKNNDQHFRGRRNDEGAWLNHLTNEKLLELMKEVADKLNLDLGLDVAASSFYNKKYHYHNLNLPRNGQIDYINGLIKKYNLLYIEDPLEEKDFGGFAKILSSNPKSLIVGDDLTVTHYSRLKKAIKKKSINAIIIKPNQNGSLFEVEKVVKLAKKHGIKIIVSHRSGETMDDTIADLAVAWGADYLKTGIYGPERRVKLKRLMEIEMQIRKSTQKKDSGKKTTKKSSTKRKAGKENKRREIRKKTVKNVRKIKKKSRK